MGINIQIRNVPEDLRDAVAASAKERGQSMQAYLLEALAKHEQHVRQRNWVDAMFDRMEPFRVELDPDEFQRIIREGREDDFDNDRHEYA